MQRILKNNSRRIRGKIIRAIKSMKRGFFHPRFILLRGLPSRSADYFIQSQMTEVNFRILNRINAVLHGLSILQLSNRVAMLSDASEIPGRRASELKHSSRFPIPDLFLPNTHVIEACLLLVHEAGRHIARGGCR